MLWYGVTYKINNVEYMSPVAVDDAFFDSLPTTDQNIGNKTANDALEIMTFIDEKFNNSGVWQTVKAPLYVASGNEQNAHLAQLSNILPNFIYSHEQNAQQMYDSNNIARGYLSYKTSSSYRYYTCADTASKAAFPVRTMSLISAYECNLGVEIYVTNSANVVNDTIIDPQLMKVIYLSIYHSSNFQCSLAVHNYPKNSDWSNTPTSGKIVENPDPYQGAGDSTTGGGDGTFDGTSDPVPVPNLPSVGAQDSGFITLFAPTVAQLKSLAYYMWVNPLFDVTTGFKKLFSDPMDCILGLSVVPVSIPTSGTQNVTVGNIVTSVSMNVASQQYIEVDCGTIDFSSKRYFGSYLDFEPYTKMALFLPYCGTHQINADDVIGRTVGVVYHIDILTGSCIAFVKCGDSVLYEFNGACGSNIPVNSLNFASTIENAIRIAVNIGTTVATAGAAAPATAAAEGAQMASRAANIGRGISLVGSTAEGALSLKPSVSRSGALGGGVGILGHQTPYFIITRPRLCKPKNQDFFEGYPSFIQTTIGDLIGKGFTSFTNVIIASQYLTDAEETELEEILKGGVYL